MKISFDLFGALYGRLEGHRVILFAVTILLIVGAVFVIKSGRMDEDITAMLPDGKSEVATDFALLQQAPLSRKGIVSLGAERGISTEVLLETTDHLAAAMKPPWFLRTVYGPDVSGGPDMIAPLLAALPRIITSKDLTALEGSLTRSAIRTKLAQISAEIQSSSGWPMKDLFQADPLDLRMIAFRKLEALKLVPDVRIEKDHFVSPDGRNALIIAEMGPKMTDSGSSRRMLQQFEEAVRKNVPPGITATIVSGHQYAVANADTIKKDLVVVLGCSSVVMAVLYLFFLRDWRSIFVFLVPTMVLAFGTAAVLLVHRNVSSATVGFASVLLGITDDFPIYVYLAVKKGKTTAESVARISRPLLFSGITILGAFGAMLSSALPGQRQIGLFSMVCVAGSILLSLVVLPHTIYPIKRTTPEAHPLLQNPAPFAPRITVALWVLVLGLSVWQGMRLQFNGDIRAMNYVPEVLQRAEQHVDKVWGNFRDMAMVFANGHDMNSALEANDSVFRRMETISPSPRLVSLAPLIPSPAVQQSNRIGWNEFWKGPKGRMILDNLREESDDLGFSKNAFQPFVDSLLAPSPIIGFDEIEKAGLQGITESLLLPGPEGVSILTLVSDVPGVREALEGRKPPPSSSIRLVSPRGFRKALSAIIVHDFVSYVAVAFSVIVAMLLVLFRNIRKAGYALIPVLTGMVFMIGAMGALDMSFNIFNIVAAILVIGLGVDFGIFMVYRVTEGHDRTTDLSVLLGGLTTVAGIGMLVLARHPALHSIGTTVLLGLGGAVPSALLVIPAIYYLASEKGIDRAGAVKEAVEG